jgi:hypothetical protein
MTGLGHERRSRLCPRYVRLAGKPGHRWRRISTLGRIRTDGAARVADILLLPPLAIRRNRLGVSDSKHALLEWRLQYDFDQLLQQDLEREHSQREGS